MLLNKFFGVVGVQLASTGLTIFSGIILARILGPSEYGLYSFVLSLIVLLVIPITAGIPQLLMREIAYAQLSKNIGEIKGLLTWSIFHIMILSVIIVIFLVITIRIKWFEVDIAYLLSIAMVLIPLKGLLIRQNSILNAFRKPVLAQVPDKLLAPFIALVCYVSLLLWDENFTSYLIIEIQIFTTIIAFLISLLLVKKTILVNTNHINKQYYPSKWRRSIIPFAILTIVSGFNGEIASVILGILGNIESVAYFKVALQGVGLVSLGLVAVNAVTGPEIARMYKSDDLLSAQLLLNKSVKLSCTCSLPITFILMFCGEWVIVPLFGIEYLPAVKILSILCIGQIANVLMGSVGLVLNMTGNEKKTLRTLIITFIFNILLLIILVPSYHEVGAAVAVTVSMILWNILMAIDVYKTTQLKTWLRFSCEK
ncbi:polysaccharide biosynthesis C-terminal domain-containing protein [Thalassomonas sp. M1454]|uniref:oligosaccharide flippase family protein n=1 Tax=Thalassomonas sp. M1454 TaxID=2594477 RepID=UPI00117C7130|nr:polysaccharide biosynthesis C-terminal domain-containing protein [Thalassomonas sp. M1454]TRX57199.1 oligosaccharide flippase family protein [Thalassomonas sp. M1454]